MNIPAATLDARRLEASSPISIPIQIRLSRDDVKTLRRLAAKLEQLLRDTPGSARVRNDWGEDIFTADLKISEDRAALDGISTAEVAAATTASLWPACATAKSRLSSGCTGLRAGRLNPNDGQTQSELAKLCLRRDDTAGAHRPLPSCPSCIGRWDRARRQAITSRFSSGSSRRRSRLWAPRRLRNVFCPRLIDLAATLPALPSCLPNFSWRPSPRSSSTPAQRPRSRRARSGEQVD